MKFEVLIEGEATVTIWYAPLAIRDDKLRKVLPDLPLDPQSAKAYLAALPPEALVSLWNCVDNSLLSTEGGLKFQTGRDPGPHSFNVDTKVDPDAEWPRRHGRSDFSPVEVEGQIWEAVSEGLGRLEKAIDPDLGSIVADIAFGDLNALGQWQADLYERGAIAYSVMEGRDDDRVLLVRGGSVVRKGRVTDHEVELIGPLLSLAVQRGHGEVLGDYLATLATPERLEMEHGSPYVKVTPLGMPAGWAGICVESLDGRDAYAASLSSYDCQVWTYTDDDMCLCIKGPVTNEIARAVGDALCAALGIDPRKLEEKRLP